MERLKHAICKINVDVPIAAQEEALQKVLWVDNHYIQNKEKNFVVAYCNFWHDNFIFMCVSIKKQCIMSKPCDSSQFAR
ncbi:MAG: hypothetical protein IPL42_09425 [Saprospiraceae bacterium]|nr:hypothetical protein [Saprospiraceae bacterium]